MTGRRFSSSPPRLPARPERRTEGHQDQDPTYGHAEGVPDFPEPLPGSHFYTDHETAAVPVRHELDVGPASPYYGKGGMAHGVEAPVRHGGRPTPRPEDRHEQEASRRIVREETSARPDPVPVVIVETGTGNRPLMRTAFRSVSVPAPGADPIVLVPRNVHRKSVRLLNESTNPVRLTADLTLSGGALLPAQMTSYVEIDGQDEICAYVPSGSAGNTVDAEGSVTSPAAFTTIAIIPATSLPAGEYTINVVVSLAGTVTQGTDNNNFKLVAGTLSAVLDNTIGTNDQPFGPFNWLMTGSNSILVQNVAAATTGAIYSVTITATPVDPSGGSGAAAVSVIDQYGVAGGA
jgi:hypothetical protein